MVHLYPEDLEHCPVSKVPFFGDGQFVEDLKVFGSGYTIFMHLAIFSAFALVSEIIDLRSTSTCNSVFLQASMSAYYCRLRWGWEEQEVGATSF